MAYRRTPAVQQRLDAVRGELVRAALGLIAERGYGPCSVAEVAARAGVGTGTVYGYFPSKGELFAEVFRVASGIEVAAVRAAAETEGVGRSPCVCERVTAAVETFARRALRAPRLAYALLAEPADPLVDAERLAFRRAYRDLFAAALTAGIAAGEIPDQDVMVTSAALVGAVAEALVVPLAVPTPTNSETTSTATIASLLSFTLRSLGGSHDHHSRGHQPGAATGRPRRRGEPRVAGGVAPRGRRVG
ncbi:MAG: TetR/AcrR family transcriptional regulator [Mycobacteriales bacterium]